MGRFFAASCGTYLTRVVDLKENDGTNYCILDGGINHLTYAGQVMGLKAPVTANLSALADAMRERDERAGKFDRVFGFDVHAKAIVRALVPELLAFARIDDGLSRAEVVRDLGDDRLGRPLDE